MKTLLIIIGAIIGIAVAAHLHECASYCLKPSDEVIFILESVENDTLLMEYIVNPTTRLRTRQAVKEFNKKYPTE